MKIWIYTKDREAISRSEEKLIEEAEKVSGAEIRRLSGYSEEEIAELYAKDKPAAVLFVSNEDTMGMAASLAVKLDAGISQNVFGFFKGEDGRLHFLRPVYDSMLLAETASKTGSTQIATVRITGAGDREKWHENIPIDDAEIVVCVGRGAVISGLLEECKELAKVLSASVGATRAVTEAQILPISKQIGQTGKYIRPRIYIGLGVSGAIQHMAGMRNSDIIIAVNNDRRAPIFEHADYGVVGDLREVLPYLKEKIEEYLK